MVRWCLLGCVLLSLGCGGRIMEAAKELHRLRLPACIWAHDRFGTFRDVYFLTATGGATIHDCEAVIPPF